MDRTQPADLDLLRDVTAAAAEVFTELPRRRAAITYLRQRGIDASDLSPAWILGYAPPGWTRLVDALRGKYPDHVLLDAGLARRCSRGTLIDTFRERVIFGIRDRDGTIAGFIGRDLSGHETAPKYLNTRQHALFDKGALLFGLHEGTQAEGARQPVVVEGPLDVLAIAARQQRDPNLGVLPLAPSGTAFTFTHARRVAEAAEQQQSPVVVAMDSDVAGRSAGLNAGERLRRFGLDVKVAALPNGTDPAEYLAKASGDAAVFRAENGLTLIDLRLEEVIAQQGDAIQWPEGRTAALHQMADYLATYPPETAALRAGQLMRAFDLQAPTVTRELAEAFHRGEMGRSAGQPAPQISM
jgi:DNA primase